VPDSDYRRRSIVGGIGVIGVNAPAAAATPGAGFPPNFGGNAIRFYFEDDATAKGHSLSPPVSPAFAAAWGSTASAVRRWLTGQGQTFDSPMATKSVAETSAAATDVLIGQFVSAPLIAQTLSGSIRGQISASEDAADADMRTAMVVKVVSNDGLTVRGTLLAIDDASALSSEFATSFTNRKLPLAATAPATLTPVTLLDGDRLVVELGYRSHNVLTASKTGSFRTGTATAADLTEDETSTLDNRPWIEFSNLNTNPPSGGGSSGTVTFAADGAVITQAIGEVVVQDATAGVKVTQAMAEVTVQDATPAMEVTQLMAEVVVSVDIGAWDVLMLDYNRMPGED